MEHLSSYQASLDDVDANEPIGFRDEPRFEPDTKKEYEDDRIVVSWEPAYCIHVANCLSGLPDVFDARRRPWIELDHASADEIADVVMTCPTGALHFRRLDGGEQEPEPDVTTVELQPDGPMYLRGKVRIEDHTGRVIREDTRVALCRCGGSANKPFCDDTHRLIGFRSGTPRTQPGPA
jgi:uncharacterized Fe-S cluster protein YjdI/CDGSH-type Zn-finger protein